MFVRSRVTLSRQHRKPKKVLAMAHVPQRLTALRLSAHLSWAQGSSHTGLFSSTPSPFPALFFLLPKHVLCLLSVFLLCKLQKGKLPCLSYSLIYIPCTNSVGHIVVVSFKYVTNKYTIRNIFYTATWCMYVCR